LHYGTKSISDYIYFITFIDNHSKRVWTFILKFKDQTIDVLKHLHTSVKRKIN